MTERRIPPGRAGRMWLRRREQTTQHAVDLLDRKLRILRIEAERFQMVAAEAEKRWQRAASAADRWGGRAAGLTGRDGFRAAATLSPASARIVPAQVMGVAYPSHVEVSLPGPLPGARSPGSAALDRTIDAYREAVRASAENAVSQAAVRVIEAEVLAVRMRRTAITQCWLPQVRRLLAELEARLEENERAETARWRQLVGESMVEEETR